MSYPRVTVSRYRSSECHDIADGFFFRTLHLRIILVGNQLNVQLGYVMTPFVGNVVLLRKPQSTVCVSVRLWPHSGMHIWVPSFLDLEDIRVLGMGDIWNFVKGTGLL